MLDGPGESHDGVLIERFELGTGAYRIAVKDSIDIQGLPTRLGSPAFALARPAARHADVVEALLAQGGRIIGKANLHELAYGVTGVNPWTGTPANPRFPAHVPGGSSSGSAAAVAAGIADIGIGTDTGGSIRVPAACCAVVGLKPSFGLVSRSGVWPAHSSLDCVGPLARDVATIEWAMARLAIGFRPLPAPARPRLAFVETGSDPHVVEPLRAWLGTLDLELKPIRLSLLDRAFGAALAIIARENWAAYGTSIRLDELGDDVAARLAAARDVSDEELAAAEDVRKSFTEEVDGALLTVDALAMPTLPVEPPLRAEVDSSASLRLTATTRPFNLSGHPAISLPVRASFPLGLQLVGRRGGDTRLCALARLLEPACLAAPLAMEIV